MPPQSSLPPRDGRAGSPLPSEEPPSPSSSHGDEHHQEQQEQQEQQLAENNKHYYTDDDFALLHEIVTVADSILHTLPEQDCHPTQALFNAAEEVLPRHGYSPERPPAHISRFIFRIGGEKAGETLSDKFRTILERMGIQLDLVPTSPAGTTSSNRSRISTRRNVGGNWEEQVVDYDDSDLPPRIGAPRSRQSSAVSRPAIELFPPGTGQQQADLPIRPAPGAGARPRSHSLTDYDSDAALEDALLPGRRETRREEEVKGQQEQPAEEIERPVNPVLRAAHALSHITSQGYHPHEEEDERDDTIPELPLLPFQAHVPVMERARQPSKGLGLPHEQGDLSEPEVKDASTIGDTVGDTDAAPLSPRTEGSDLLRSVLGDTTAETQDEAYSPPSFHGQAYSPHSFHGEGAADLELLEGQLHQFKVRDGQKLIKQCLTTWRFNAVITRRDDARLEQRAADYDDMDIFDEVLGIWNEEAVIAQEERIAARKAAVHDAYVAKMEKRAQRVYEILTLQNALTHWQDRAQDEADRTAVARRHLVRKRAFDGWRAQHIEDETKVQNFVLIHALQKWTQVSLHHEVRNQVAIQRYEKSMAQQAIRAMWEENKGRIADEFRWCRLAEECLRLWSTRAQEVQGEMEVAEAGDDQLVLYEVVDIWREEAEELQYLAYEGSMRLLAQGCLRDLEYWHEQAKLKRLLKQHTTKQVDNLKHRVLNTWYRASLQQKRSTLLAEAVLVEEPISHWRRQAKLRIFLSEQEYRTKSETLNHWCLEERLAWYQRHLDLETQRQTLHTFLSATRQARSTRVRCNQEAAYEYAYFTGAEVVENWSSAAEATWKHRHNANLILLYRTTMPVLEFWQRRHRITAARTAHNRLAADQNARRGIVGNVLDIWPTLAERAKRERLMNTLREFRRNYKIELAEGCLEKWWLGTRDSIDQERTADGVLIANKRSDIHGYIDHWGEKAYENKNIRVIAADAEVEIWCGAWQRKMEEMEQIRGVAVRFDVDETVKGCWQRLEFQSLQRLWMGSTVAAVREKNERRFCARVLDEWAEKAAPAQVEGASLLDPRFSTLSRRSLRQREAATNIFAGNPATVLRSTLATAMGRGGGGGGFSADNRNVFTPAGSLIGGGGGYQRGGGRATTAAHRVYTSGGNDNTFETPQPLHSQLQQPLPPVSQLGARTRQQGFSTTTTAANRPLHFGTSIAATPAQPTPTPARILPEFDIEDDHEEDSLLASLTGGNREGDDGGDDSDGPPPDLGFMSTPSRKLSRAGATVYHQQQPAINRHHRNVSSLAMATTTPSAILASPYERELRRVYGQTESQPRDRGSQSVGGDGSTQGIGLSLGGQTRSLGVGRGGGERERAREREREREIGRERERGGRSTRVVEFADIREESAEL